MLTHTDILLWRGLFLVALLATILVGAFLVRLLHWFRARSPETNIATDRASRRAATIRRVLEGRRVTC